MASITSRIAGWTAGRLKGEKARKRTMDWMQKTGVGQLLGVAGDAALIGGALKGAGALKGLLTGGKEAGQALAALPTGTASTTIAPRAAGAIVPPSAAGAAPLTMPSAAATPVTMASRVPAAITPPTTAAMPTALPTRALPKIGGGITEIAPRAAAPIAPPTLEPAKEAGRFGEMLKGGAKAVGRGAMATGRFAKENVEPLAYGASALTDYFANRRRTDLEEEQLRLEQERRNRLAELLMPMFQAEVQRYGQSNRG